MFFNFIKAIFLLFFLLLLLTCCAICQPSSAEESNAAGQKPLILFQEGTNFEKNGEEEVTEKKYKFFTSPSFGYFGDLLVVFAQAKESDEKCEVVEGFVEFKSSSKISEIFGKGTDETQWKRRVVKTNQEKHCSGSPTAVFNNTHIFVLFNSSNTGGSEVKYQVIANKEKTASSKNGITWGDSPTDLTAEIKKKY